jgi:hypothetical protein
MNRYCLCFLCAICATFSRSAPVAEILTVQDGTIYPTNVAANVQSVAAAIASAQVAAAKAEAVEIAASLITNAVAGVTEIVNSLEGIGYIRGYVLQFGSGIEANTNMTASIIKFASAGTTPTNTLWDVWTYFTEDPGAFPLIRWSETADRSNEWSSATAVGTPALEEVLVGETLYEAYRNRIAMPLEYDTAFFRTFSDVVGAGTNTVYLPVCNGIAVNDQIPLTATFIDGTNTFKWVGGVRVQ